MSSWTLYTPPVCKIIIIFLSLRKHEIKDEAIIMQLPDFLLLLAIFDPLKIPLSSRNCSWYTWSLGSSLERWRFDFLNWSHLLRNRKTMQILCTGSCKSVNKRKYPNSPETWNIFRKRGTEKNVHGMKNQGEGGESKRGRLELLFHERGGQRIRRRGRWGGGGRRFGSRQNFVIPGKFYTGFSG